MTRDGDDGLLAVLEARRSHSDSFAWAAPGLAIAGQAFLLTIALSADTKPTARLIASLAGFVALIATMHLLAKQAYYFDLYEAAIAKERQSRGLPGLQLDDLRARAPFPEDTTFVQRNSWEGWRRNLVTRWKAVHVWLGVFAVLAVIDLAVFLYAGYALIFGEPDWLGNIDPDSMREWER